MKNLIISVILLFALFLWGGCNKDKGEVDQLEQEVMEAESEDYLADTTAEAEEYAAEPYAEAEEETVEMPAVTYEPTATGGYTIQIGAGLNSENARYLAEKFIGRGYEAFITEAYFDDITYYRVRIGNFATVEEATVLGAELKDKYSVNFWIDSNI
jgi:cell division septation protein DedD